MKSYRQRFEEILKHGRSDAAKRLREKASEPLSSLEIVEIENLILASNPEGLKLDRLIDTAHEWIAGVYPALAPTLARRVVYEYPKYKNVLAEGFARQADMCQQARHWLRSGPKHKNSTPERELARAVVSLILEFQLLDPKAVVPVVRALAENRLVGIEGWRVLVPCAIPVGRCGETVDRLFIASGSNSRRMQALTQDPAARRYLMALSRSALEGAQVVEHTINQQFLGPGRQAAPFTVKSLIEAACQMAIPRMPTCILAHRTGVLLSHALNAATMQRIGRFSPRFPDYASKKDRKTSMEDESADEKEIPEGEFDEEDSDPAWLRQLRTLVKQNQIDVPGLQIIEKSSDPCGQRMASFALFLHGKKGFATTTVHRYVLLIANRLMIRFDRQWAAVMKEKDAWEDLVEKVLDDDAFYHRRRYTTGTGRDEAGYSRPLLKALGSFVEFLNRGRLASESLRSTLPPVGSVRVEATLITVDEYQNALDWFESEHANRNQSYLNNAARIALILAYRCGLRRAEVAYLRASDFDPPQHGEQLQEANVRLHIRPWFMRKLKTPNALRDLPLRALLEPKELERVLLWVEEARTQRKRHAVLFTQKLGNKPLKFDRIVAVLETAFRRRYKDRPAILPNFHMHQTRHACAGLTLLRLMPELRAVANRLLSRHPKTRKWIARDLRPAFFGVSEVHGADLQSLALTLGHGSAGTSVEFYLHVLDWYTPAEVRQLNIAGPQARTPQRNASIDSYSPEAIASAAPIASATRE